MAQSASALSQVPLAPSVQYGTSPLNSLMDGSQGLAGLDSGTHSIPSRQLDSLFSTSMSGGRTTEVDMGGQVHVTLFLPPFFHLPPSFLLPTLSLSLLFLPTLSPPTCTHMHIVLINSYHFHFYRKWLFWHAHTLLQAWPQVRLDYLNLPICTLLPAFHSSFSSQWDLLDTH